MSTNSTERRKQIQQILRQLADEESNIAPVGVMPTAISQPGPDPQVQAGRAVRAVRKQALVNSVPGATMDMSEVDIRKRDQANNGTSLVPSTPGIDEFKRQNSKEAIAARQERATQRDAYAVQRRAEYQAGLRSRVSAAAAAQRAQRAPVPPPMPSSADPYTRMRNLAPSLRPGDKIAVKDGNQVAAARGNADGTFDVAGYSSAPGTKISAGPGKVKTDSGKWVPIKQEIDRMSEADRAVGERANQNAAETAAVIQRNQDSNPGARLARAVAGFQDQQARAASAADPYRPSSAPVTQSQRPRIRGIRSTI